MVPILDGINITGAWGQDRPPPSPAQYIDPGTLLIFFFLLNYPDKHVFKYFSIFLYFFIYLIKINWRNFKLNCLPANGIAGQRHTDVDGFAVTAGHGFGDGHGVITGYLVTVGHLVTGHTVGDEHGMGLGHVQVVVG